MYAPPTLTHSLTRSLVHSQLIGYRGRARVMVSLVSDNDPPVPHAHSIVGKNSVDGKCFMEIGPESDMYAQ